METYKDQPVGHFVTVEEWKTWLEENYATCPAVWVKFAKKGSTTSSISYEQARDTAIAYGWIDGLINKLDNDFYLTRFTPRKANSGWSKINCEVAEALIAGGLMHPAGHVQVEAAKADGRWGLAYDSPSKMTVPDEFQEALNDSPAAHAFFARISASNRYSFLYRLQTAKTAATRAARIAKFVAMLEAGETFHPDKVVKSPGLE